MQRASRWIGAGLFIAVAAVPIFAATTEVLRNEKVIVTEETLAPGEQETVAGAHASVVVFLSGDSVEAKFAGGGGRHDAVQRGEVLNEAAGQRIVTNVGHTPMRLVRTEFLTAGSGETWGMTGLPPNYKVLLEDQHSRTYEIRIAPHAVGTAAYASRARGGLPERCATRTRAARWNQAALDVRNRRGDMAAWANAYRSQPGRHRSVGSCHRAEVSVYLHQEFQ